MFSCTHKQMFSCDTFLSHDTNRCLRFFVWQENPNVQPYVQKIPRPTDGAHLRVHQPVFPHIDPDRVREIIDEGMARQSVRAKWVHMRLILSENSFVLLRFVGSDNIHSFQDLCSTSTRKLLRFQFKHGQKEQFSGDYRMCQKGRKCSKIGRPFHTVGATTEEVRLCLIVVQAKGLRVIPSSMKCREQRSVR